MMDIKILGRSIELELKEKSKLKGITIGDSIEYTFYEVLLERVWVSTSPAFHRRTEWLF